MPRCLLQGMPPWQPLHLNYLAASYLIDTTLSISFTSCPDIVHAVGQLDLDTLAVEVKEQLSKSKRFEPVIIDGGH